MYQVNKTVELSSSDWDEVRGCIVNRANKVRNRIKDETNENMIAVDKRYLEKLIKLIHKMP